MLLLSFKIHATNINSNTYIVKKYIITCWKFLVRLNFYYACRLT